jgi:phosphoribosylanthranilate isomerase
MALATNHRYISTMTARVKICGITNREDAFAALDAGADALGFILYDKSKRFIRIEDAIRIVEGLPPFVQTVAVTVNAMREFTNLGWRKQLKNFNVAQLHGQESPTHVKAVGKYLPVIKVFPAEPVVATPSNTTPIAEHAKRSVEKVAHKQEELKAALGREPSLDEVTREMGLPEEDPVHPMVQLMQEPRSEERFRPADYESLVAAFMLDTPSKEHGGTGRVFDWALAVDFKQRIAGKPLILSGGLNPENVAKAIEVVQPYAVDVSSGVEASPGRKDHAKLREFIRICKSL